jgi:F-type H+-transporting ATPase subunit delta
MGHRTMAVRYATALADVLPEESDLMRAQGELDAFAAALRDDAAVREGLLAPSVAGARRREAVERVARQAGFHPATRRLLGMLAESRELDLLDDLRRAYAGLCDARRQIVAAEVTTAVEIPAGQTDGYRQSLEKMTGRRVRLQTRVDPAILGGVVTRIGSEVYDGSVRSRLQRLGDRLRGE